MGKRALTQELLDTLLLYFRSHPAAFTDAAKHAGCTRGTASKAWGKGFPQFFKGKPLQLVLLEEQEAARAALLRDTQAKQLAQEKEREEARAQAVEARKQEGMMVRGARAVTSNALLMARECVDGAKSLSKKLRQLLEAESAKPIPDMKPEKMVTLLRETTLLVARLNNAAHITMQMERLHLGQPTDILGITAIGAIREDISYEEVELRIKAAQQALEDARKSSGVHGGLRVIEGGVAPQALASGDDE